jgi:hypothetical protein
VLARSKKQLNRLASSFKPQTMYSSFIFNSNSRGASGGDSNGSDENVNPNVSQSQVYSIVQSLYRVACY